MSHSITIADINDPSTDLAIRELIRAAYDAPDLIPEKMLAGSIQNNASKPGFFLIAMEENKIVGCNAFLPNDFLLDGNSYTGYQSCWSATHPQYRGKNIFSDIINEAKRMLKAEGAGFLYGIANEASNPIFTSKLGFTETPSRVLRMLNIPFIKGTYFTNETMGSDHHACIINEGQVRDHKLKQFPADVKTVVHNDSWLWGKLLQKKKYGIRWPVFYVGGIHLASERDLKKLVAAVYASHKVAVIQFFSCQTHTANVLLKGWKKPAMNDFIFYNLNMPAFTHFNIMIGAIDIF